MDASLTNLETIGESLPLPSIEKQRTEPDFIVGEIITTPNGVVLKGTFGEVAEKVELSNGVKIEGVFYE